MSNTANRVGSGPISLAKIPCNILLLVFTLVLSCLVDWIIALSHNNKEKHILAIFTLNSFYTVRDLSSVWKIHTQPQQLGTSSSCWSPAWSHTAVAWHPIPQPGFVASQPTCLGWSLWHIQHAQVDPTWSSKRKWIPTEKYCRGFWQTFLGRFPHCELCCSFHECTILATCTSL